MIDDNKSMKLFSTIVTPIYWISIGRYQPSVREKFIARDMRGNGKEMYGNGSDACSRNYQLEFFNADILPSL